MKVLGSGLISVDNLFVVRKGRPQNESDANPASRYIGSHGGGSASNTLCILSKLGFQTSILGAVGKDAGAELVFREFQDFDVDTTLIARKERDTRQFTHLIYPNNHVFNSVCPICRRKFSPAPLLDDTDVFFNNDATKEIFATDICHVDRANGITLKLVDSAYQHKKVISFDFGNQASWGNFEIASEIIKRSTILKTSQAASRTFLSRMGKQSFHEMNPNMLVCVTTLGDEGARITYRSPEGLRLMTVQPYHPSPIVDRGGAGDAFHAGLLYGLRDIIPERIAAIESESSVQEAVAFAQGLGGLACTDYGARGYFLKLLHEDDFEAGIRRDFEKLVHNEYSGTPEDPDELFAKERNKLLSNQTCGVCHRPFLSAESETLYETKIDSGAWVMSNGFIAGAKSPGNLSQRKGERIYFVGSGASYSVAHLGALFLNHYSSDSFGIPITPYEYVSLSKPSSSVVLISFGGENPDILSTLERATDLKSSEIHVITGSAESTLAQRTKAIGGSVHNISSRIKDSGFVSSAGMLSCASTLLGFLTQSLRVDIPGSSQFMSLQDLTGLFQSAKREIASKFQELAETLDRTQPMHFVVLGSGWAWPAVIDLEARMTEGAVATSEISELKNYTHGRYLNAYRNKKSRFFIVFSMPQDWRLVRFLRDKLSKEFPLFEVATHLEPPFGTLELMIKELYLSSEISKKVGLDIAKAIRFPKESRGLFSWGPIYSPGLKIDQFVKPSRTQTTSSKNQTKLS